MVIQSWIAQAHSAARFAIVVPVLAGCKPDLIGRPSVVDSPQVIAIRSTPAEAQAQQQVTYDVMVAQPLDDTTAPAFDWALCLASKPLATTGPIAESCLAPSGPDLQDLGSSQVVTATLPSDDCQLFGPTPPAQKPGQPAVRPVDPDTTGGYYQPVRLLAQYASSDSQYDVGVTRISCGIESGATQAQTVEFAQNYRPNQNPGISQITFTTGAGASIVIDLTATSVASVNIGANLNFEVTWPSCPLSPICGDNICSAGEDVSNCPSDCQNPQGCEGSEPYLSYDTVSQSLVNRRESIRVSWFATGGSFDHDTTGRTEAEADQANTSNDWTAPNNATSVRFWLVIRDDRRGVNWTTFDLQVTN